MIRLSIDQGDLRWFRYRLRDFIEEAGKTENEAMQLLGKACAKELAITVPPFGLSAAVGKKFQQSIAKQVNRAINAGNVAGTPGNAAAVLASKRNSKGQVPRGLRDKGRFRRDPISVKDKEDLIDRKQNAAGVAKGAWIAAAEKLNGKKISGVGKWVRRHANKNGKVAIAVVGKGTQIALTNEVPFIQGLQKQSYIDTALKRGYMRSWRHMTIVVKKLRGEI